MTAKAAPHHAAQHSDSLARIIEDVVLANRILSQRGILDGFGHISARHPEDPTRFLLSRSLAPELVTADDIMTYDVDSSEAVGGDTRKPYLERFIHGEIYRARPDVMSIVHSHSPSVIPFAASSVAMRPIYHMAGFLSGGAPVFDMRHCFGCTDMLVRNREQGAALAKALGERNVSLMRGHGYVTTGPSIPVSVFRAIYTETNAGLQQKAISLGGEITYLDDGEAANADETNCGVMDRPWQLWRGKALAQLRGEG